MLFSIYPPWHLLLHSTTCFFHASCLILPRFSEILFFSLWSLLFCQILFEWSLSLPVSISCLLSNDTFGNIQKAYLERKRSVGRKTSSLTLGFSHILKYDILFILKMFSSFQKWILVKPQYKAVRSPFTFLWLNFILCKRQSLSCPEVIILEYK